MTMNIALIFPRTRYPSGQPPLGILYLAAYLRRETDCHVDIIDTTFERHPMKYVETRLRERPYDLIGLSVMTSMLRAAKEISRIAKQVHPQALLIWGGPHPTVLPEETLHIPQVDAVALGEGEETLLEIVQRGGDLDGVAGVWYKANGDIRRNPSRPMIQDISVLPHPARDLIDMGRYIDAWYSLTAASPLLRGTSVITSRGCPYSCTYCQPTLRHLFGRKVRRRSVEDVIAELRHLKETYNIDAFMFEDDTFVVNRKWVFSFCEAMREANLGLVWGCNSRADLVEEEMFRAMRDAGLVQVNLGIESGSQRILDDLYDKRITIQDVENAASIAKKLGLKVGGYFMLGAPTETEEEIETTIRFAARLPIDEAAFNITTPLPGTYLYDRTKHLIVRDISEFDYYRASVYRPDAVLPSRRLDWLKKKAYIRFYLLTFRRARKAITWFFSRAGIRKMMLRLKRF